MKLPLKTCIAFSIVIFCQEAVAGTMQNATTEVAPTRMPVSTTASTKTTSTETMAGSTAETTNGNNSSKTTFSDATANLLTDTNAESQDPDWITTFTSQAVDTDTTLTSTTYVSQTTGGKHNSNILDAIKDFLCDIVWLLFAFSVIFLLCLVVKCLRCFRSGYKRIKISQQDKHINQYQKWLAVYSPKGHNVVCTSEDGLKTL